MSDEYQSDSERAESYRIILCEANERIAELEAEAVLLAMLASGKPEFFTTQAYSKAKEIRDKILSISNSKKTKQCPFVKDINCLVDDSCDGCLHNRKER